jgi:hypothetical protein
LQIGCAEGTQQNDLSVFNDSGLKSRNPPLAHFALQKRFRPNAWRLRERRCLQT